VLTKLSGLNEKLLPFKNLFSRRFRWCRRNENYTQRNLRNLRAFPFCRRL